MGGDGFDTSSSPRRRGPSAFACAWVSRDNRLTSLCFRRASLRAGHFSLLAQREVTKRKGTRVTRPLSRVRCGRPGSADGPSMARSGIGAIHRADPSGLIVRPPPRHTGSKSKDRAEQLCFALDPRGCPSLWLLSLGQARESDSLARDGERKSTGTWGGFRENTPEPSKALGPGFRRDDEVQTHPHPTLPLKGRAKDGFRKNGELRSLD